MKHRCRSFRKFFLSLIFLLILPGPVSVAIPRHQTLASNLCPRCSHRLTLPPPPPILNGEGDRFLCRWEIRPDNPYLARFVTCSNCGLTLLPADLHLNNLASLIASIPSHPVHTPLERLSMALHFYRNPTLSFDTSLRGLWNIICALHYMAVPYPDPSWNRRVQRLWNEIRTLGMERWPVWRWYESLAFAFERHARRSRDPAAAALATDFFRKIGYLHKATHYLEMAKSPDVQPAMQKWLQNEQQLLDMETSARNALMRRIQIRGQTQSFCSWNVQSVLYVGMVTAYDARRSDLFIQWTETLLKCPTLDPILLNNAIVPLIRHAWLSDPRFRSLLNPLLSISLRSKPHHEPDQ